MELEWILVILYSPLIVVIVPFVFLAERLFQNKDEKVEQRHTTVDWYFKIIVIFIAFVTFPRVILNYLCLGWLGNGVVMFLDMIFLLSKKLGEILFVSPLFSIAIPFLYNKWNERVYRNLPLAKGQIRVLCLPPGNHSDDLSIDMRCESLKAGHYEALSYSWGGHLVLRRIIQVNGRSFLVADTVLQALRQLRHSSGSQTFWIDSVSINQGDLTEKNQQVQLMQRIYQEAERVVVWLGKAPANLHITANCVSLHDQYSVQGTPPSTTLNERSLTLAKEIMRRRWWSRVWIVQEVSLNDQVDVRIGSYKFSWQDLSKFLQSVVSYLEESSSKPSGKYQKILDFIQNVSDFQHRLPNPPNGLLDLAIKFRHRTASNPLDKLYGLQALLQPDNPTIMKPDYKLDYHQLFAQFASAQIYRSQSLAILGLAEICNVTQAFWAVDWQQLTSADWAQFDLFDSMESFATDIAPFWTGDLLPSFIERSRKYSAVGVLSDSCCPGTPARALLDRLGFDKNPIETHATDGGEPHVEIPNSKSSIPWFSIRVTGWIVDKVAEISEVWDFRADLTQVRRTWDRIIGNRFEEHQIRERAAAERCVTADAVPPDSNIACILYRRVFKTAKGRLGLGSAKCRSGNIICVLVGSNVPVVLDEYVYGFHGQAYVNDLMDYQGDIEKDIKDSKVKLEQFTIS